MCVCVCVCVCVCSAFFLFFTCIILYVNCFGRTMLYMCIQYNISVNMYHVNAQGVDERMINVHYYYYDDDDDGDDDDDDDDYSGCTKYIKTSKCS